MSLRLATLTITLEERDTSLTQALWGNREDIQRTGAQTVKTAQSWGNMGVVTGVYQVNNSHRKMHQVIEACASGRVVCNKANKGNRSNL